MFLMMFERNLLRLAFSYIRPMMSARQTNYNNDHNDDDGGGMVITERVHFEML